MIIRDEFAAWIKVRRDGYKDSRNYSRYAWTAYHVLDDLLDEYRLHVDTKTPLNENPYTDDWTERDE